MATEPNRNPRPRWIASLAALSIAFLCLSLPAPTHAAKPPSAPHPDWIRFDFHEPHPQSYYIHPDQWNHATPDSDLTGHVGHPAGPKVTFGRQLVLQTTGPLSPHRLLQQHYVRTVREVSPSCLILEAPTPSAALTTALALQARPDLMACYPLPRRSYLQRHGLAPFPNDTYYSLAWHIDNRNQIGQRQGGDLNFRSAWPLSRGDGIAIAIADNGIDLTHPDLETAADAGLHFDFGNETVNGNFLNDDAHGTAVAGLIAAEGYNETGVIGVAPEATLASHIIFEFDRRGIESIVRDDALMDMFAFRNDAIAIQNHSWGNVAGIQSGIDALSEIGIRAAVNDGRRGRGVILIRAGGNERELLNNANDDGFTSDPRAIAVAAVRFDGHATSYTTPGAPLLIAAPSGDLNFPGVATTDHQGTAGYVSRGRGDIEDYLLGDAGFAGTSAAAPIISGLVALLLDTNPELTYRDVQQILIHAGAHWDPNDPALTENAAGFRHSHLTGFGVPDAGYAVELAKQWKLRPEVTVVSTSGPNNRAIPDTGSRLLLTGPALSARLRSIVTLPGRGRFPDTETDPIPLRIFDPSLPSESQNLDGQAALLLVNNGDYATAIEQAAEAGAAMAVIYTTLPLIAGFPPTLAGTEQTSIPSVSIRQRDGESILTRLENDTDTQVAIGWDSVEVGFDVTDSLLCEHVGVRINTTHTFRGDLRITLQSPQGTKSVLQAHSEDRSNGPRNWTYWSVRHFYEASAGTWRVQVTDQQENDLGVITSITLFVRGVPLLDIDADGLEDNWERLHFRSLRAEPHEDPDGDGLSNAREQILEFDPTENDRPLRIDYARWKDSIWRLTWPSNTTVTDQILVTSELRNPPEELLQSLGRFPRNEYLFSAEDAPHSYFNLKQSP